MTRVAVVTDSTAYLPQDFIQDYDITVLPLHVVFGDTAYAEEEDLSTEAFYEKVKSEEVLPTTSQPTFGNVIETFETLGKSYDAIVAITLSSGISGTYESFVSAGNMVENVDVRVFDSEISCMVQGFYVLEAARMAQDEASADDIMARLEEMKASNLNAYFMVDDLSHLKRGGRLTGAQAFVGGLLQIKPVLVFEDKVIIPFEKIRTRKKAIKRIKELVADNIAKGDYAMITVIHANRPDAADKIVKELQAQYPHADISKSHFGPVIGTHLGEGALGIGWYNP